MFPDARFGQLRKRGIVIEYNDLRGRGHCRPSRRIRRGAAGRGGGFGFEVRAALKLEGEKLSGKVSTTFTRTTETEITNASFKDGNISFETERERSDGTISVTKYSGKMDGDTIKGRMEFEFREELQKATWEATRVEE